MSREIESREKDTGTWTFKSNGNGRSRIGKTGHFFHVMSSGNAFKDNKKPRFREIKKLYTYGRRRKIQVYILDLPRKSKVNYLII